MKNARCIAARLGGEEFALLLSGPAARRAAMIAEDLRRTIAAARPGAPDAGGTVLPPIPGLAMTVSIGVCPAIPGEVFRDLYRKADAALYRAKHEGRDRVVVAAPGNDAPRDRGQLEPVPG
ncbi:GGDEF domain-containing protein [Novosphingobium sp. MBES04]|uniref:GGDEF domain-containing protein n=1 Tax=Novosphingobium sp. MBES04 TaxID=1206458 RepID=UPI0040407EE3